MLDEPQELPYVAQRALLTGPETVFFRVLSDVIGDRFHVWIKIRLWDLVEVPRRRDRNSWLNRISQKHVDFVLSTRDHFAPVLAIELDGSSHDSKKDRKRDSDKDDALKAAGIPVARFQQRQEYDRAAVLRKVREAIRYGLAPRTLDDLPVYQPLPGPKFR